MFNKDQKNKKTWIKYILLGGFILKLTRVIFMSKKAKKIFSNFKDFFSKEKDEVIELAEGGESFRKYFKNSCSIFSDYFIPNSCNGHKPKILRTKSLAIITISAVLLKIALTAYLFLIYPSIGYMTSKIQDEIFNFINDERKIENVAPVARNLILEKTAVAKAGDMIAKDYFAHKSTDGKMVWDMINRNEYPYLFVGENLAMNFTSALSAHKALMRSPSHKKNILNPKYTEAGIAVVNGEISGKQTNVLVQVFAYPKTANPATAKIEEQKENTIPPSKPVVDKKPISTATSSKAISQEDAKKLASLISKAESTQPPAAIKEGESKVLSVESETANNEIISDDDAGHLKNITITPIIDEEMDSHIAAVTHEIDVETTISETAKYIKISHYIFIFLLGFLIISLLINIVIRITVQHKSVIVQTLAVILFIYGLLSIKLHFLETITEKILIS